LSFSRRGEPRKEGKKRGTPGEGFALTSDIGLEGKKGDLANDDKMILGRREKKWWDAADAKPDEPSRPAWHYHGERGPIRRKTFKEGGEREGGEEKKKVGKGGANPST